MQVETSRKPSAGVPSQNRREYLRSYQREWQKKRREEWIAQHGPCAACGSHDRLEVDHIDPSQKQIQPRALWGMSRTNPKRIAELAKCQVLCYACHKAKSLPLIREKCVRENLTRGRNNRGQFVN